MPTGLDATMIIPMATDRWEYTIVDTVISAYQDTDNQVGEWLANLNTLGQEGWELVSDTIIYARGRNPTQWPVLLLKRRIPEESGSPAVTERPGGDAARGIRRPG